jgi:hypothetical protein
MTTQITGLTISGSEIKIDYSKGGKNKPLYGNWYYNYGATCTSGQPGYTPCPVQLTDYLAPVNGIENTAFYLGIGFYEGKKATFGSWTQVNCDKIFTNQIINFGGWGACPGDPPTFITTDTSKVTHNSLCNNDVKANTGTIDPVCLAISNLPSSPTNLHPKPNVSSTGPNCVWEDTNIDELPSIAEIKARGFNGVSVDIEGCTESLTSTKVNAKFASWNGLIRIITIPGNSVKPFHGGMKWFNQDVIKNMDYLCLMYYAIINDTECNVGI